MHVFLFSYISFPLKTFYQGVNCRPKERKMRSKCCTSDSPHCFAPHMLNITYLRRGDNLLRLDSATLQGIKLLKHLLNLYLRLPALRSISVEVDSCSAPTLCARCKVKRHHETDRSHWEFSLSERIQLSPILSFCRLLSFLGTTWTTP